jgi:hypothetical protein
MTSIALFNNKGGVGKTTLTYHLAHMIRRLGLSVLAVDLDPQANLTSMCLEETEIEELWENSSELIDQGAAMAGLPGTGRVRSGQTIADAVRPILEGTRHRGRRARTAPAGPLAAAGQPRSEPLRRQTVQ